MIILGINAYHGDSAACIVVDGRLVAAVEEERLLRIKHWAGFPTEAIQYCLDAAGCSAADVDHLAVNRDPKANLIKKAIFAIRKGPSMSLIRERLRNAAKMRDVRQQFCQHFGLTTGGAKPQMHYVEHHVAHLASAFLVSPYDRAACVSIDGFGDFVGAMWGLGEHNSLRIDQRVYFPHSLGLFYLAITQFLGFPHYGDEFKVMGLAAYGSPKYMAEMRKLVHLLPNGGFALELDCFRHHGEGVTMTWEGGAPTIDPVYSGQMTQLLGPPRSPEQPLEQRHRDLAASMQAMYEEALFHVLNHVARTTGADRLCLAGGCAMNSLANGKIVLNTPFREVYIPPAPGDAGGAIGAAYYVWNCQLRQPRSFVMDAPYWGPEFSDQAVAQAVEQCALLPAQAEIERLDEAALCRRTAEAIAAGEVVGWFQGRLEWGPRALGNRSILVDPRHAGMKDILNSRIKRRESFRPFAPAILDSYTGDYFEQQQPDPFMSKVYKIRAEKRADIPTAAHEDGTGRLQTVSQAANPRYWRVIDEFRQLTGVPIVINTSFNENEPIVHTPEQAIDCFLRTKMDVLAIGPFFCRKRR
ncbi:MAG TPA: carbamoyltransferase C-terminal domain-containing protein [Pirellulales bacterium]|nr:carbamoyltransferase C-terminal domain-containing protein [Pirellulales bacterium]